MGGEGGEVKQQRLGKEVKSEQTEREEEERTKEGWHFIWLVRRRMHLLIPF